MPCGTIPHKRLLTMPKKKLSMLPKLTEQEIMDRIKERQRKVKRESIFPVATFAKNQGRRGSCNYYAACMAMEKRIKLQFQYYIKLSPEMPYAFNVNGNDQGSLLRESNRDIKSMGFPPFLQRHYEKIRKSDFTAEDIKNGLRFTGFQTERITSWLELLTAVLFGFPCVIAIHAGRNFMNVDSSGFAGVDNGMGNHAICVDLPFIGRNGRAGVWNQGSWGRNVHRDGICGISESHIRSTINRHQFWALTSVNLDPEVRDDFKVEV